MLVLSQYNEVTFITTTITPTPPSYPLQQELHLSWDLGYDSQLKLWCSSTSSRPVSGPVSWSPGWIHQIDPNPGSSLVLTKAVCRPCCQSQLFPAWSVPVGWQLLGPWPYLLPSCPLLCPHTDMFLTYAVWPVWGLQKWQWQIPVLKQSHDTKRV